MASYVKMALVMVVGMIWLSMAIAASSAQADADVNIPTCWKKIFKCVDEHVNNDSAQPEFNTSIPSYSLTDTLCCPLVHQTVRDNKPCFCAVRPVVDGSTDPDVVKTLNEFLSICSIADSRASLDALCKGVVNSGSGSGSLGHGAKKITYVGLVSTALLLIWAMVFQPEMCDFGLRSSASKYFQ